jgi:hypothetical protein
VNEDASGQVCVAFFAAFLCDLRVQELFTAKIAKGAAKVAKEILSGNRKGPLARASF